MRPPEIPLSRLAALLGLEVARGSVRPCPACRATRRGRHDRRGPVGLSRSGLAWSCHACGSRGGGPELVGWVVLGTDQLRGQAWRDVLAWYEARGHVVSEAPPPPRPAVRPDPAHPPAWARRLVEAWLRGGDAPPESACTAYYWHRDIP